MYRGFISQKFIVKSGVPQSSNLGPLLFLLFINDIATIFNIRVLLFADDLKLFTVINSAADCIQLQENLDLLQQWCLHNKLNLNISKCKIVSFCRKVTTTSFDYSLGGINLTRCSNIKDLGILFDSELNFNLHIRNNVASGFKTLGFIIRSCRDFNSLKCLKLILCMCKIKVGIWRINLVTLLQKVRREY